LARDPDVAEMMRLAIRWAGLAAVMLCASAQAQEWSTPLFDGFDGPDFVPAGGLYYKQNFEQSAGTVDFQKDVKLHGEGALKLSVKPICPPDDEDCSERAEVWEKPDLWAPYDHGVWFGFAVKFADPVPADDHRYLIAQWKREILPHAEGDYSPFLAFRVRNGKLFATVETNYVAPDDAMAKAGVDGCGDGATPVWFRPETNQMRALVATDATWTDSDDGPYVGCTDAITIFDHGARLPSPSSGWIDLAVFSKPGPDGTGHIEIFANGKPVVTIKGHIGHAADKGLGDHQYFKFGPYRAAHDDEWALYYDDFRRSPNCADVMDKALCPLL
jgi:hypothetical protein